ncbi:hypothetical protein C2S53_016776 [Perilla frutescens var. hirtella]|uniref:Secreted protein n=1 Tax=Perilla frutescens var. hirtella TaxID=608512 RepID=A0AAD4J1S1_PERFH|nr:hypothetical protein C2S53_016776 [Perilla frutescens var. hirtella]
MAVKIIILLVLVAGQVCLATNRKMIMLTKLEERIEVAPQPATSNSPADEEMKNHHTIPRESWDSNQDDEHEDGTSTHTRG